MRICTRKDFNVHVCSSECIECSTSEYIRIIEYKTARALGCRFAFIGLYRKTYQGTGDMSVCAPNFVIVARFYRNDLPHGLNMWNFLSAKYVELCDLLAFDSIKFAETPDAAYALFEKVCSACDSCFKMHQSPNDVGGEPTNGL